MSECIRKWIKIGNVEDFGKFKYIILMVVLLFSLFTAEQIGFTFLLIYISSLSYQIISLHKRHDIEDFLLTSHLSKLRLTSLMFLTCILNSLYVLPLIAILLVMKFNATIKIAIIVATINYLYASSIGILIGSFVKNQLAGLAVIIVFFGYLVGSENFVGQEDIRYLSPLLQLNDINNLYLSNLVGILGFAILVIAISVLIYSKNKNAFKYSIMFCLIGISIIGTNFYNDIKIKNTINHTPYSNLKIDGNELNYRCINKDLTTRFGQIIYSFEDEIKKLQLPIPFYKVNITRGVNFFYDKVPIANLNNDGYLQLNVISPGMNNIDIEVLFADISLTIFQTNLNYTDLQRDILNCIRTEIQYRTIISNKYNNFTKDDIMLANSRKKANNKYYSSQVSQFGKNINNFMIYIIDKHPDKLKDIYDLSIVKNAPETEAEFYKIIIEKHPSIWIEYKGGNL